MEERVKKEIERWKDGACKDSELSAELAGMSADELLEAFSANLSFGTAGLRGIMGPGTNRMNIYTVAKASKGLADYVLKEHKRNTQSIEAKQEAPGLAIAIAYDSRNRSRLFAEIAAGVFAANGIHAYIYPQLMPTPCLSWAVRRLSCAAGVNVTASHNPAAYNGYKVYGADGCQITSLAAEKILKEIEKLDIFKDVELMDFAEGQKRGLIEYIQPDIITEYLEEVKKLSMTNLKPEDKNIPIVYSPLNGAGLEPVLRVLSEEAYTNITVVAEQEKPDGDFPTCTYPNPESRAAMELAIKYAREHGAGLAFATDPDCDRLGAAVKRDAFAETAEAAGEDYVMLSGNEIGILLLDYICAHRPDCKAFAAESLKENRNENKGEASSKDKNAIGPVMVKTVVSSDMAESVAKHYGVRVINVLTGFKYIGEQIGLLEAAGRKNDFVLGFEESYGYLSGTHVRDKDAVNAALLICEMYAYYRSIGKSLLDRLEELYKIHGYHINKVHSYEFPGLSGFEKMRDIMKNLRKIAESSFESGEGSEFAGKKIAEYLDFSKGIDGLPKTDMLKLVLAGATQASELAGDSRSFRRGNSSVIVRPSGTEPKLKVYISVIGDDMEGACAAEDRLAKAIEQRLGLPG